MFKSHALRLVVLTSTLFTAGWGIFDAAFESRFSSAQAATTGVANAKEQVAVPEAMLKTLAGRAPEAKDRRVLAQLGLQKYLRELLLPSQGENDAAAARSAKIEAWVQQIYRSKFDSFVPSFNVKMSSPNQAEVKLLVARQIVLLEAEKAGLGDASTLAGSSAIADTDEDSNTAKSNLEVPFAALLIDEKSHDVYVYPPEAVPQSEQEGSYYHFKPASASNIKPTEFQLSSLESSLPDRATVFASLTLSKLSSLRVHSNVAWAREVVVFLEGAGKLQTVRAQNRPWPPSVTLAASPLLQKQGVVAVFTVRNSEKSGILEKLDLARFAQGHLIRSYWSRSIQDPALTEKVPKVFERMTTHFLKQIKSPKIQNHDGVIRLIVDKKVPEKELAAVEGILRSYVVGNDNILVPYEVTRADVRYFTPVVNTRIDRLLDRIKKDVPGVHARAVPGEGGYITLAPQTSKQAE